MMDCGFHCPHCQHEMRKMSRNLDFFCRSCYTSVVVIDEVWAEVMRPDDREPQRMLVASCRRQRGTQPLKTTKTTFLDPMVIAS